MIELKIKLPDFVKTFAAENRISVTEIFRQYISALKYRAEKDAGKNVDSQSAFDKAMTDVRNKLQNGTAVWHSYNEVFGK